MNRILIFTNYDRMQWILVLSKIKGRNKTSTWKSNYPILKHPLSKINLTDCSLSYVDTCDEGGIYFAFDEKEFDFTSLKEKEGDQTFVLIHKNSTKVRRENVPTSSRYICKEDSHVNPSLYLDIVDILTDDTLPDRTMERIIRLFWPKLETVVRFLNECLIPENDSSELFEKYKKKLLDDFYGISISVDSVEYFVNDSVEKFCNEYKKYKKEDKLEKYEKELIALRDILIAAATK